MCARQLRVNEVGRYAKQSDRLILEEHGHCEVPAGCGGVVLRWRDPRAGMPVVLWLYSPGDCEVFIDGAKPASGRPNLGYGEHILAFRLRDVAPRQGSLMFAAECVPQPGQHSDSPPDPSRLLVSRDDGSWRYTTELPDADSWRRADFDDSHWQALVEISIAEPSEQEYSQKHRYDQLRKLGSVALGAPISAQSVHVRKKFNLTPEGIR